MKTIYRNATVATMQNNTLLSQHDIVVKNGVIQAITPTGSSRDGEIIELDGALVTPGLIDCHTHLVFGGNRAGEWEQRLNGVPYTEIAENGGGINTTVTATRTDSHETLYQSAVPRLQAFMAEGVTTIECKSGYGLNLDAERKQLAIAKQLGENFPVEVVKTLLSAHTTPPEYQHHADDYIDVVCEEILPTLHSEGLVDAVDVFCESVGFSLVQSEKIFQAATALGIPVKGHTEQLSNLGGSALVASYNGLSADHIEYLDEAGVMAMQQSHTVATLLPLAYYFLQETQSPPIALLRKHKVPMAVATDFNPGTAPMASLRLAMNMACVQFGLTPTEAWLGVTKHAAKALGIEKTHGQIATGYVANLAVWDVERPVDVIYELGRNPLTMRIFRGKVQ